MAEAGWAWRDLELVAVTVGPGTFTGLRAGIAVARALGLALDCPALGVGTLEIVGRSRDGIPTGVARPCDRGHRCAPRRGLRASASQPISTPLAATAPWLRRDELPRRQRFYFGRRRLGLGAARRRSGARALLRPAPGCPVSCPRRRGAACGRVACRRPAYGAAARSICGRPTRGSARELAGGGRPPDMATQRKPSPVSVRTVGPFDLGRLSRLHKGCFEEAWSRSDLAHLLAMPGGFGLIARLFEGGLAGFDAHARGRLLAVPGGPRRERAAVDRRRRPPIGGAASPATCCAASMERARTIGARQMFLEVAVDNLGGAATLSRSMASSGSAPGPTTISARTASAWPRYTMRCDLERWRRRPSFRPRSHGRRGVPRLAHRCLRTTSSNKSSCSRREAQYLVAMVANRARHVVAGSPSRSLIFSTCPTAILSSASLVRTKVIGQTSPVISRLRSASLTLLAPFLQLPKSGLPMRTRPVILRAHLCFDMSSEDQ